MMKLSEEYEKFADERYDHLCDLGSASNIWDVMDFERKFIRMAEQLEHIDLDELPRALVPVVQTILEESERIDGMFEEAYRHTEESE